MSNWKLFFSVLLFVYITKHTKFVRSKLFNHNMPRGETFWCVWDKQNYNLNFVVIQWRKHCGANKSDFELKICVKFPFCNKEIQKKNKIAITIHQVESLSFLTILPYLSVITPHSDFVVGVINLKSFFLFNVNKLFYRRRLPFYHLQFFSLTKSNSF